MENEQHPDTFQPTENRYSDLEEETFRRGNSGLTKGFISTDNEPLKFLPANVPDDVSFGHRRLDRM